MEKRRKNIALVTGASSGLGRCFVLKLSEKMPGLEEIWVIARREEALEELRQEIEREFQEKLKKGVSYIKLRPLVLDLTDEKAFLELEKQLRLRCPKIRVLVNAAGVGHGGAVESQALSGLCDMVDVNCRALTAVTRLCLPYLGRGSRVIQIASGSAFLPQPGFAVYAASKSYVLSFSRALREELKSRGITVTAVCPGPVDTDFFRAGGITLSPVKRLFLAKPEPVVRKALRDAHKDKALSVYGVSIKAVRLLAKLLPHGLLVRFSVNGPGRETDDSGR